MLTMLGPGRSWHRLSTSVNSSSLSQRRSSTSILRANGVTPPNPETATCVNRRKSSRGPGIVDGDASLTASSPGPAISSSPSDERRRTPWRGAESRDAYRPASWKCSNARAFPERRGGPRRTAAGAWRRSASAYAGARAAGALSAAPTAKASSAPSSGLCACRARPRRARLRRAREARRSRALLGRGFAGPLEPGALREPGRDRVAGLASNRHGARLRALARHGDLGLPQQAFAVGDVQAQQLREPQARRVEQLEHGPVAQLRRPARLALQQPRHKIGRERLGQRLRAFRRAQARARVVGKAAVLDEPMEESAPAREEVRDGPARHSPRVQPGHGVADMLRFELIQGHALVQHEELLERASVISPGPGTQPPLVRELVEELFEQPAAGVALVRHCADRG